MARASHYNANPGSGPDHSPWHKPLQIWPHTLCFTCYMFFSCHCPEGMLQLGINLWDESSFGRASFVAGKILSRFSLQNCLMASSVTMGWHFPMFWSNKLNRKNENVLDKILQHSADLRVSEPAAHSPLGLASRLEESTWGLISKANKNRKRSQK